MVLAASGPKSAAGASLKSASQSNATKTSSSGPRGPTGPSSSQPRTSPAGGSPGSVSRSSPMGKGGDSGSRGIGGSGFGSTTSSQASPKTSAPNVGRGPGASIAASRASAALNAGLGRPISGALNVRQPISAVRSPAGAALGSFRTATEPAVRNYLQSPQGLADAAAGWSEMSRMAKARVMAREALSRPGVAYPNSLPAPQGVFGPRQAPRQGYLRDANALGMITSGMPSALSGLPQRPQSAYAGYGNFNVPKTPQVLNASMGNTTTVQKNMASSPVVRLPDGSFASSAQYQEVSQAPSMSTYSGYGNFTVPERVLGVETVAPRSNAGSFANYASQGLPPGYADTYFSQPAEPTLNAVPSWQQSAYTGASQPSVPPNVAPSQREPLIDTSATPYKAFKAGVSALGNAVLPGAGTLVNAAIGWDINRINQMTPAEQEAIKARWAQENRAALSGNTSQGGRSDRPPLQVASPVSQATNASAPPPSGTPSVDWQADALAYGYSQAQLKDAETSALIKQLWDMGFIPKTSAPP